MEYDNPAARLLSILEAGKNLPGSGACRKTWHHLLQTDGSHSLLMSRLGKLFELPRQIEQDLQDNFPDHVKHARHWSSQVETAFMSQNLLGDWGSFIGHIDAHTISYLSLTAELLQTRANTKTIADDSIHEIRERLSAIYDEVLAAEIPDEVRVYLVRYIRSILNSIDEYFLTGALPVLAATGTLLGHTFLDERYRSVLANTALGTKLYECLTAMANVVTVAVGIPQLSTALALLPAP